MYRTVLCPVARRLLRSYHRASLAFREATDVLLTGMRPNDPRFPAAQSVMATANEAVSCAQREYWKHVREHGCGTRVPTGKQREIIERLRRDMLRTREVFDNAVEKCEYLVTLAHDVAETPDGGAALTQASNLRIRAYTLYLEALRRYADFSMLGEFPEEERAIPAQSKPN